jgi:hypothetical protein
MTKDNNKTGYKAQPNNMSSLSPSANDLNNMMARFPPPVEVFY